jgi:hypothetical protein
VTIVEGEEDFSHLDRELDRRMEADLSDDASDLGTVENFASNKVEHIGVKPYTHYPQHSFPVEAEWVQGVMLPV